MRKYVHQWLLTHEPRTPRGASTIPTGTRDYYTRTDSSFNKSCSYRQRFVVFLIVYYYYYYY